jgi:hypothetical protein
VGCGAEKVQVRIGGERFFDSGGHVELLPMEGERYGRYRCAPFGLIDTIQSQVTRANVWIQPGGLGSAACSFQDD